MSTQENNTTVALTYQNECDIKNESQVPPDNLLIEKQAEQFEEFGKQLQKSLQAYENEKNVDKNIYEKFQKKFDSQSELISELRSRIEELEINSMEKDKNIKNLHNFSFFKNYEDIMDTDLWHSPNNISSTAIPKLDQLHSRIRNIANLYGESIKLKQFKFMKSSYYSISDLIEYTKTTNFNSLNKKSKRYINFHIKSILSQEFEGRKVNLSQDLDEYIKRDILPRLPRGYDNYKNDVNWLNTLSDTHRSRVIKLITRDHDEEECSD